jgi:membrane-associated protease RseP (regulator of RpoE activity)
MAGGVDVKVTDHFWIRLGQGDYLYTKHDFSSLIPSIANHQNNYRASAGIVFNIGGGTHRAGTHRAETHRAPARVSRSAPATMPIPPLGISVSPPAEGSEGAQITDIQPGGVAELAVLHVGDVINSVDGKAVKTPMELAAELANKPSGTQVHIGYIFRTETGWWIGKETVVILGSNR